MEDPESEDKIRALEAQILALQVEARVKAEEAASRLSILEAHARSLSERIALHDGVISHMNGAISDVTNRMAGIEGASIPKRRM